MVPLVGLKAADIVCTAVEHEVGGGSTLLIEEMEYTAEAKTRLAQKDVGERKVERTTLLLQRGLQTCNITGPHQPYA